MKIVQWKLATDGLYCVHRELNTLLTCYQYQYRHTKLKCSAPHTLVTNTNIVTHTLNALSYSVWGNVFNQFEESLI